MSSAIIAFLQFVAIAVVSVILWEARGFAGYLFMAGLATGCAIMVLAVMYRDRRRR